MRAQNQPWLRLASELSASVELQPARPAQIMVVDDSVTVRKVTSRLLERSGIVAVTAKYDIDAMAQLEH